MKNPAVMGSPISSMKDLPFSLIEGGNSAGITLSSLTCSVTRRSGLIAFTVATRLGRISGLPA